MASTTETKPIPDTFRKAARKIYRTGRQYQRMADMYSKGKDPVSPALADSLERCSRDMFFIFSKMVSGLDEEQIARIKRKIA